MADLHSPMQNLPSVFIPINFSLCLWLKTHSQFLFVILFSHPLVPIWIRIDSNSVSIASDWKTLKLRTGLEPILSNLHSKVPISIPNWSNFSLCSKRRESKNCSTGMSGSSFSSNGPNWTCSEPPSPWFWGKNHHWRQWVSKELPIWNDNFDISNRQVTLVLPNLIRPAIFDNILSTH